MTETKNGERFLHEQNPHFQQSLGVKAVVDYLNQGGAKIPNSPEARIKAYLEFLGDVEYVNDGILTGDPESIDRQVEAATVTVNEKNAEANAQFDYKVARELGYAGDIPAPSQMDMQHKLEALRAKQSDQKTQLHEWIDELGSEENNYPDWFKYWTYENVIRHTAFNEDMDEKRGRPKGFERRSAGSFALFPELDRESLSLVYDALVEKLGGEPMGFEYDNMRTLLHEANFGKLYTEAQNYGFRITPEMKQVMTGVWRDFAQSDHDRDARALSDTVSAYRTGWCTAGKTTAKYQLQAGDFSIWCSTNPETGKNDVPRIAVRMEQGRVAEVRGIVGGRRQELEPELMDVVMEKVKNLPGGEAYFKKAQDMKRLTAVGVKLGVRYDAEGKASFASADTELSSDEIRFLYEIDNSIDGFGYSADPRVAQFRKVRGERDHKEIAHILPELLKIQAQSAYDAYRDTAKELVRKQSLFRRRNGEVLTWEVFEVLLKRKMAEWRQNGVMDYLVKELIEKGSRPNLVAVPNVAADYKQLKALAVGFGEDQPYPTYTEDAFLSKFTSEELSGNKGDEPVRLMIIPSGYNLQYGTVEQQRAELEQKQRKTPKLGFKSISALENIVYFKTLRARGIAMQGNAIWSMTFSRDIGVEARSGAFGGPCVPSSGVDDGGKAGVDGYHVGSGTMGGSRWGQIFNLLPSFFSFSSATLEAAGM